MGYRRRRPRYLMRKRGLSPATISGIRANIFGLQEYQEHYTEIRMANGLSIRSTARPMGLNFRRALAGCSVVIDEFKDFTC